MNAAKRNTESGVRSIASFCLGVAPPHRKCTIPAAERANPSALHGFSLITQRAEDANKFSLPDRKSSK